MVLDNVPPLPVDDKISNGQYLLNVLELRSIEVRLKITSLELDGLDQDSKEQEAEFSRLKILLQGIEHFKSQMLKIKKAS